jgi:hypothetical protein
MGLDLTRLSKVRAHKTLEVKVGELIISLKLKELGEAAVRIDLAAILLVLKIVLADVGINLASNLSASHLSASSLAKERSKLRGDESGLYKTARRTVTRLAAALSRGLVGNLKLASGTLLKLTEISLKSREHHGNLVELGESIIEGSSKAIIRNLTTLLSRSSISGRSRSGGGSRGSGLSLGGLRSLRSSSRSRGSYWSSGGSRSSRSSSLGCLGSLGGRGSGGSRRSDRSLSLSGFSCFGHLIILYYSISFLSVLTQYIFY